jgi:phage terminase large subunit-like protein
MTSDKMLWMPRSLGVLEDMILNGEIVIDESPITKWCAGNAAIKADARGNRYLVKAQQRGRIDGLVVLAMLAGAAEARGMAEEVSFWEAA